VVADGKLVETIHKDAVDHMMIQGKLTSGAVASISVRIFRAVSTQLLRNNNLTKSSSEQECLLACCGRYCSRKVRFQ
jgi:hypothetical protein